MDEELIKECIGLITWIKQWYFTPEYVERMDKLLIKLRAAQQKMHPTDGGLPASDSESKR
jgi:hypothetical protein